MQRCWLAALLFCSCVSPDAVECELAGETWTCPARTLCNPAQVGCATQAQLDACNGQTDGAACTIGSIQGVCITQVCEPSRCGDGLVVAPEQCDLEAVANVHACVQDRGS